MVQTRPPPEGPPGVYTTPSLHGDWFYDPAYTPAPLPWSAKQFPSLEVRQLVLNRPYFFDIGWVDSRQKLPICRTDHGNPNHTLEPNRYSLEIVAYAENGRSQTAWVDFDLRRWQWPAGADPRETLPRETLPLPETVERALRLELHSEPPWRRKPPA